MSGYVTQSRDFARKLGYVAQTRFGPDVRDDWVVLPSDQTTTSFRSSISDTSQEALDFEQVTYNPFLNSDPDDKSDRGHVFDTIKRSSSLEPESVNMPKLSYGFFDNYGYKGPLDPYVTGPGGVVPGFADIKPMSDNDIKFYGTSAISQCEPTNPNASLSQFLGEIFFADKELPQFDSSVYNRFLTGGGSVSDIIGHTAIAVEFGFKPFLNDLKKLMKQVQNTYKVMKQYAKDSGKPVRRRFHFPEQLGEDNGEVDMTGFVGHFFTPYPFTQSHDADVVRYTRYTRTKMWFSGSFTYYLPVDDNLLDRFARYDSLANQVLGSDFTPSTLWELAPYSWLIDWKLDVGKAISLSTDMLQHGLVMRYGYLMREVTSVNQLTVGGIKYQQDGHTRSATRTFSVVRKERHQATPFGFGVDPESFSPEQIAILVALGMTRGLFRG